MTHQENYSLSTSIIEELAQNGLKVIPELVRVILNSVMQAERSQYLQAKAYERTEDRQGHANGYREACLRQNQKRSGPSLEISPLLSHKCEKAVSILQHWKRVCEVNEPC